ncbi:hypothetical protein [Methylomonas koyamae]|uniref:hypothetical protein n=1 Tax=Methylomonas koyamae TaxID=702114 RepID=UPI001C7E2DEE|nr:hypothetical protein [Methylomonas koyamae]
MTPITIENAKGLVNKVNNTFQKYPDKLASNRLVKNPLIFPLTHGFRDFFVLKSVMTSSFNRFAPVSRAFYSPEAVCGRFSGALRPRWAHSTPVSA